MKKISSRLANLTPEQREKLLTKLREQKKEQQLSKNEAPKDLSSIKAVDSDLKLSFSQQRIWFIDQLSGQQAAYHIPALLTIEGDLDTELLEKSFSLLIERHESLRMRFDNHNGFAKVTLAKANDFHLMKTDLSHLDSEAQDLQLKSISEQVALNPFRLEKDTPIRAKVIKLVDKSKLSKHALLICMHHIISDAWSMGILIKEISFSYSALNKKQSPKLGEAPFRYLDYSAWQHAQLESNRYEKQREYWKNKLQDLDTLNLPIDKLRPPQQSFAGQQLSFVIPSSLSRKLQHVASSEGRTIFMVLLGAWKVLLYRYTAQEDICVGTPVANRNNSRLENTIGLFINTLAIRSKLCADLTFREMLSQLQKNTGEAFANQDIPFDKLIDELEIERDMSQSPIFQNLFSYQDKELAQDIDFEGLSIDLEPIHTKTAKFDLSLSISSKQDYLSCQLEFNTDLFYSNTINSLGVNFITLLESIAMDTSQKISVMQMISEAEHNIQLNEWERPKQDFPQSSIAQQFYQQAKKTPDRVAVHYKNTPLTYKELDEQSNVLANYLLQHGLKQESYVGLCLDRNIDLIVSIFAVIKIGAAYLPIDSSYPPDRIKLLISEGKLSFLLSQKSVRNEKLKVIESRLPCPVLEVDLYRNSNEFRFGDLSQPAIDINPEQLLYVIFTSGSSGVPKRTGATHRSESNLVSWYHSVSKAEPSKVLSSYDCASSKKEWLCGDNRYVLMSPISFDLAQKNIFTPLLHGDLLVLPDIEQFDPQEIISTINEIKATCVNCSPSAFYSLLQNQADFKLLESLRYVFLGGESIQLEKINEWLAQSTCQLINTYGPSECTDIASFYVLDNNQTSEESSLPIGKPSKNVELFVLDDNFQLLPLGAHGQLFIGGEGVGPGYLGNTSSNNEKFIENPISGRSGTIYATGDRVRYTQDGDLQYLGREDDQIKIRGHRVEVAEIVSALLSESKVIDAAVTLIKQENGHEYLVAYLVLVSIDTFGFEPYYFKQVLKNSLPDFMIPSAYLSIEKLPLSPNGKLDLKSLPKPDFNTMRSDKFLAPSNENEIILQEIWQKILGLERVGVHDNFFELGGDSILSIQIISAARKQGLVLRPNQIFRYPTILELAQVSKNEKPHIKAEQGLVTGTYDLSPIQSRFFTHFETESNQQALSYFNQSILLRLTKPFSLDQIRDIALKLATHHDTLSLSFIKNSGANKITEQGLWRQAHKEQSLSLQDMLNFVSEAKDQNLLSVLEAAQSSLSIESGKLFHIAYINKLKAGRRELSLYIVVHHLVMDGISWRILLEDLDSLLGSFSATASIINTSITNATSKSSDSSKNIFEEKTSEKSKLKNLNEVPKNVLSDKTLSFKQWTKILSDVSQTNSFNADRDYWLNAIKVIDNHQEMFPKISALATGSYADQKRLGFSLSQRISHKFLKEVNQAYHTEANDILLCALHHALATENTSSTSTSKQLLIQLEGHGRELDDSLYEQLLMPDISRTIGWFTSLYPVLLSIDCDDTVLDRQSISWASYLKTIKEQLKAVPNKGIGFGLHSINDNDQLAPLISHSVQPLISFNYLGQFDTQLKADNFIVNVDYRKLKGTEHIDQHRQLQKNTALDVLMFISDGCLHCDFLYDSSRFQEAELKLYLNAFEENIKSLVNFCSEKTSSYLTPSDLRATDLNQQDIEIIEKSVTALTKSKAELESIHDLLPIQSGMLFHSIFSGTDSLIDENRKTDDRFNTRLNGSWNNAANNASEENTLSLSNNSSNSNMYLEQFCVQLSGNLNIGYLEHAWRASIATYANLRSAFYWSHGEPQQLVFKELPFSIVVHDAKSLFDTARDKISKLTKKQLEKLVLTDFLEEDKAMGFKLSSPPLMRVNVLCFSDNTYWLVWTYHHILLDGWSVPLVLNEVFEIYAKLSDIDKENKKSKDSEHHALATEILLPLKSQQSFYRFEDYIAWYRKDAAMHEDVFWKKELAGFSLTNAIDLEPLALPITNKDTAGEESAELSLNAELSQSLDTFAKHNHLTLNSIMQGAWAKLLAHYSNDQDIVFGSTMSGRSDQFKGVENIVGLFINTLPLRIKVDSTVSVLDFLHSVQLKQQVVSQHQTCSLAKIKKIAGLESSENLFESIFVFENFPVKERLRQDNPWFKIEDFYSYEKTNYPITITVQPGVKLKDSIHLRVLFDNTRYKKSTMTRLLGHLETILKGFIQQPQSSILDILYISSAEQKALTDWNKTTTSYPREASLSQLFLEKVDQVPHHKAFTFDGLELTYEELNKSANRLAALLNSRDCRKGDRVVLFMDRSVEFLTSVVAASKTGAAYIPLDPNYPIDRLSYMLSDCEPGLILTVSSSRELLKPLLSGSNSAREIIYIDELQEELHSHSEENYQCEEEIRANDLAYLMYTSGSTGQAKAVCLNHRSIIRLVMNTWYLNIGVKDKIGHICNVCFDASAYEIWGALLNGATLVGFDRDTLLSEDRFAKKLVDESVTNMLMPTSLFHSYSRHRPEIFCKMRSLLAGGEPLLPELARTVLAKNPQLSLLNVYGPTENGVLTTVFDTWNLVEGAVNTPVGKPVSNSTVYIVDENLNEVPVGVVGELISGGDGVGLGYWNKPEITKKSYIADPFSQQENARMYRTGDLARRLPNGEFEVLGRRDDQLKIRGFRIEPSEIIECLINIDGIKDAVVTLVELSKNRKQLIAYFIWEDVGENAEQNIEQNKKISTEQNTETNRVKSNDFLKEKLSQILPAHMVPSQFIEIDKIPITPNGKLDKSALPKPNFDKLASDNYVAPRNQTERDLISVWSEVLNIKSVGIFDNFFELGGDSIISIQIVSRAKRSGIDITPKLLFENPSISALAARVSQKNSLIVAEQGLVSGEVYLSPAQRWFFEQNMTEPNYFNQSLLFDLNKFLSLQNITPIVSALLKQHDALRLRFVKLRNDWVQKHDNSARSLSSLVDILSEHYIDTTNNNKQSNAKDLADQKLLDHAKRIQESLSLEKGPIFKVVLYHLGNQQQKLLVIAHHLIVDGVSWRILFDDISLALDQQYNNQKIDLGPKTSSFQFFSKTLVDYAESKIIQLDKKYWLSLFERARASGELLSHNIEIKPTSTKKLQSQKTKRIKFILNETLSHDLLLNSHRAYHTDVQDILILAFSLSLKESGILSKNSESIFLDLEGHGRNILGSSFGEQVDTSKTIAWFTTIYPVLIEISNQQSNPYDLPALLMQLKQSLRDIPNQGASYMLLKYFNSDFNAQIIDSPSPEISFNYLGKISNQSANQYLELDEEYIGSDNSDENKLTHPFNFTVAFKAKRFEFQVLTYEHAFEEHSLNAFQNSFENILSSLVQHCTNKENFGFTPSDLPYLPIKQADLNQVCDLFRSKATKANIKAVYPLSPMQEGMLFHSRLDHTSGMYCEQVSVRFSGELNVSAMERAWSEAIAGHDILRTSFVWEDLAKPLQLVCDSSDLQVQIIDWRNESNTEQYLQEFLKEDRAKGFDFSQAPLMRLHYIHLPKYSPKPSQNSIQEDEFGQFIWTYHHILLDGWSMPILMREVFDRYNLALNNNLTPNGSESKVSARQSNSGRYENYIAWLYQNNSSSSHDANLFWQNYLQGFEEPNSLGFGKNHGQQNSSSFLYQELSCQFNEDQTEQLNALASQHHITLNTIMQAAWAMLLHRYSGDSDIVFGITVSGRPAELDDVESIVGLFINTIPFRVKLNSSDKLDEWLKSIFKNQVQLRQFETSSLVDIQAQSLIESSRALFESILVFENYPLDESLDNSLVGLKLEELKVYEQTNFPLSLIILPGSTLDVRLLFDAKRFDNDIIQGLLTHFKNILLGFCAFEDNFDVELSDISYLSNDEKQAIVHEQNQTKRDYPSDLYLQDIIAKQDPNALAILEGDKSISFKELELSSSQLASFIKTEYQVNSGDRVVVCLNRSIELITSILAILKLGASYVPLDPAYPEERQRYILEDTQTHLMISDNKSASLVKYLSENKAFRNSIKFININEQHQKIKSSEVFSNKKLSSYSSNDTVPAAILYTSGSTGQPKGVCLSHKGLARMVLNTNYMQLSANDRVAHVSNICFDAASFEIWSALLNGIPLVIIEKDIVLDLAKFEQELKNQQVSILLITTALFNLVARERINTFSNINYLFFGGEASDVNMVRRVAKHRASSTELSSSSSVSKISNKGQGPLHLMHMYGPSENSTYSTWYEVKDISPMAIDIPIGKSVSNTQVFIMNRLGDLLPEGVVGEIVCAGDGLSLGYLNKPEQTQKSFVMRSLLGEEPRRMYLTGDLGRKLPDGNIEILGRIDNQVKIRGYRIEPEEVIALINTLPEIKTSYVLVKEDKDNKKSLVAYYVPEKSWLAKQELSSKRLLSLKKNLKSLMPEYMVPSLYLEIDALPLTANGKIDSKALPPIEGDNLDSMANNNYFPPKSALEESLVNIWQEVLQQERVGIHDDFFELGGHSLLATQIHSRIRQQLSIDIPLRTLFELPTIKEFSDFWEAISKTQKLESSDQENDDEDFEEGEL